MGVNVRYRNFVIATIPDSTGGTKTLLTEGKYLDDDVEVVYNPPSSPSLGTKIITANGQYDASDDGYDGYSEIDVTVPNTYSASDEGKVVSNGALVAQTAHADVTPTTSDQTIDTTTNNSIKVKGDADLVAGNIKKDVEIFGVTGTYEGGGGLTFSPMDYPVLITNGRASGTITCVRITYSSDTLISAVNGNIAAGTTSTFNDFATDGTHIWFRLNNVSNVSYNSGSVEYQHGTNFDWEITLPAGYDGTIPFVFTA